ncbi:MAG: immunoglobulin-like domain-containing protein [Candidatus Humimicrobiaceae bacterium]
MRLKKPIFRLGLIGLVVAMVLVMMPLNMVFADTTGNHGPTNVTGWTNPQNSMVSDGIYTTGPSIGLTAKGFGFNIPENATINGIEVNVERFITRSNNKRLIDNWASLLKNGVVVYNNIYNRATGTDWKVSTLALKAEENKIYGSPTDTWGLSLTPADVNNPNFGFLMQPFVWSVGTGLITAYVDYIGMTVYYTLPDTTPPVIDPFSDMTVEATSAAGAVVNFSPTATDNVDGSVTVIGTPLSGSTFAIGTTQVTLNAMDVAGNAATPVTFNVTVQDTTPPVIALTGDNPMLVPYLGPYNEPGATWTDAVDGTGAAVVSGDTVDVTTPGDYTVKYNYTDVAGNAATEVTRTVTVLPWSTINISKDIRNWKGEDTTEANTFTVQLNGADSKTISETVIATYDMLPPGVYTITELADEKYFLNGVIGAADTDVSDGITITVGSGETINLTLMNWKSKENKK